MSAQEIIEGNKLIIDYLQLGNTVIDFHNKAGIELPKDYRCYHSFWDWLMPVVEKINKRDWVTIYSDECKIHALQVGEFETIDVVKEGRPLIEPVYEAVVAYIKVYNTLNKK